VHVDKELAYHVACEITHRGLPFTAWSQGVHVRRESYCWEKTIPKMSWKERPHRNYVKVLRREEARAINLSGHRSHEGGRSDYYRTGEPRSRTNQTPSSSIEQRRTVRKKETSSITSSNAPGPSQRRKVIPARRTPWRGWATGVMRFASGRMKPQFKAQQL